MRSIKKFFSFFLLLVSFFFIATTAIDGASEFVISGGAGYRVLERVEETEIKYGVKHYFDEAETMLNGQYYPQEINVLEVPSYSPAKIVSYGNLKNHKWTLTTVGDLAKLYEEEFPDQKVLAAVNGDFFDINGNGNLPYQTNNPLVTNGEYFKTSGSNAVGIRKADSKLALIGGTPTKTSKMILAIYDDKNEIVKEFNIDRINAQPNANETSVYFATYNSSKQLVSITTGNASKIFVVGNAEYAIPNSANDFYGRGVISSIGSAILGVGQFAIATNNTEIMAALEIGKKIRVQYEFTGAWEGVDNVTGQNAKFVENGEYSPHPNSSNNTYARHPRTVIGVQSDGTIILAVIDGRAEAAGRYGMFGNEMAALMKSWGVVEAYNLDGGGSSYMVVREQGKFALKSHPSDGLPRRNGNALLVTITVPLINIDIDQRPDSLKFKLDLVKTNGYDVKELYVKIGETLKPVVNGEVTFTNLDPNKEYYYEVLYKNSKGILDDLLIDGNVKTLKRNPIINFLTIEEDQTVFTFTLDYTDLDKGTNLDKATIYLNNKMYSLQNGKLILPKSSFNEVINTIKLFYTFNNNKDTFNESKENVKYRLLNSPTTENMFEIYRYTNEKILNIYS